VAEIVRQGVRRSLRPDWDGLRTDEYGYLDRDRHVYLDYTGSGLASRSQLRTHHDRLSGRLFGNPHSENPTSSASTEAVEATRRAVLSYLHASPQEYAVVFTPNATGACRLVGEAYPFQPGAQLILTTDNHNSVNGLREFARDRGAHTRHVPVQPDLRIAEATMAEAIAAGDGDHPRLLAYPAQSNFSGVQHPLRWVELAHEHGYDVLLDAAAYLPTNPLRLDVVKPDFVAVSWYKVFGYPTGVGCLVARREALARLRRPWFSGGTIVAVSVAADWHWMMDDESAFEDGTLNFLSIPDVQVGLSWIESIGIEAIQHRVRQLTAELLDRLARLRHTNGRPMVLIYGPLDNRERGGTIALNLLDPEGVPIDERLVAIESAAANISLRTGCFCNPGTGEEAFGLTDGKMQGSSGWGARTVDEYLDLMGLQIGGAVRVSLGIASNQADIETFVGFLERTYVDRPADTDGLAPRLRC
jgi:selenocysteine lyase/cysteine desulfurase